MKKWKFVIGLVFCLISIFLVHCLPTAGRYFVLGTILLLDTSYLILLTYFSIIAFRSAGEYPTDFKVL